MAIDLNIDDPDIYFLREDSLKHLRLGKIYEHFNNKDYEKTIIKIAKLYCINLFCSGFVSSSFKLCG